MSIGDVVKLPPTILGTVRWKFNVGVPAGEPCQGFNFLVEERTPTQFRIGPDGPEPIPGTSRWLVISESVTCRSASDENGYHAISFQVRGLHLSFPPDGVYRITPTLKGNWSPSPLLFFGYRVIDPIAYYVALRPEEPVQHVEFEVVRRSLFGGRILP